MCIACLASDCDALPVCISDILLRLINDTDMRQQRDNQNDTMFESY